MIEEWLSCDRKKEEKKKEEKILDIFEKAVGYEPEQVLGVSEEQERYVLMVKAQDVDYQIFLDLWCQVYEIRENDTQRVCFQSIL